jgi:hypothetical protein
VVGLELMVVRERIVNIYRLQFWIKFKSNTVLVFVEGDLSAEYCCLCLPLHDDFAGRGGDSLSECIIWRELYEETRSLE